MGAGQSKHRPFHSGLGREVGVSQAPGNREIDVGDFDRANAVMSNQTEQSPADSLEESLMKSAQWFCSFVLCACWFAVSQPDSAAAQAAGGQQGTVVTLSGLKSTTPAEWAEEAPTSRMRVKQFRLEPVGDDKDKAEITIFFFGAGQGGSAADNVKRWKGMFRPPDGKTIDDVAKKESFKVGSVPVTYLDISGTYLLRTPPFDPNAPITPYPNYRMIGVVFESEKGPYFIRLVGPANTVDNYKKGFDEWLKAFK
jgi:hypothetical protein